MKLAEFRLERYFARHEHSVRHLLCASDAEPLRLDELLALAASAGVPAATIGIVGGDRIRVSVDGRRVLDEPRAAAEEIWSTAIEDYFERHQAIA